MGETMTRTLKNFLVLAGCVLAVGLAANVSAAPAEATSADPLPFLLTGVPALDGDAAPAPTCAQQAQPSQASPTPLALAGCVCTFCNVCGYSSCQAADGTSCSSPGATKRCYVDPACYCEWGFCRCQSNGTWSCVW
jgi:hypothetical protein